MDCVAQVALDIAFSQRSKLPAVVNIVHPRPVAWTSLFTAIQQALKANTRGRVTLPLIPSKEWYELLQAQAMDADEKTILQIVCSFPLFEFPLKLIAVLLACHQAS